MAYCPKCGIKVEIDNRPCPLCNFHIPKVNEESEEVIRIRKFPETANPYPAYMRRVLNRIFIFVALFVLVVVCLMFYIDYEVNDMFTWSKYSNLSMLAGLVLVYFSFGYVQSYYKVIIGIGLDALILLFGLDAFNGSLEWFIPLAFPIVTGVTVIGISYWSVIRVLSVRRFNVIGLTFIALVILSMWINFFIQKYQKNTDPMNWIIATVLQLLPVLLTMIYVKYGMPDRIKKKIARKFHL
ncbi:hypothetical protein CV093_17200 [Oceanobacillus sp. 143]|uniref:Zinc ribbon domain-containing protein n=1 Tax=Oceanobacillus zhaokaii TaxID=2052660 RepID=A0A345PK30_9BACI|nr:DUF6320 domain-containing protein [Oceanobacillus zhaokaii]AXI10360.1 hypothetical protein CUC15_16080 [Oceanobacillus zhaokaii]QGS69402.1 hypothetical protein CV093_17200 [Oceanobacillus sp. 143]